MGGRAILLALAVSAAAAWGPRAEAAGRCDIGKFIEFPITMVGMRAHVTVKVDGQDATFFVDSGSFYSFMNREAAQRLKLEMFPAPLGFFVRGVSGVEGRVDFVKVNRLGLDGVEVPNVPFLVLPQIGAGTSGVLGQNVLSAMDTEYDLGNGMVRLMRPSPDCARANVAYWAGSQSVGVVDLEPIRPETPHLRGPARLNGQAIRVIFDTGAPVSYIKRATAERLGFRPDAPGVEAAGVTGGIGGRIVETWLAPFDSLDIGGEQIRHTRLRVSSLSLDNADMLLGADFFLSHRVYVSKQQRRIYFTYNGGAVFQLDRPPPSPPAAVAAASSQPGPAAEAPGAYANAPTDAAGYARRGRAAMSRREFAPALADFARAVELDPKNPDYLVDRAEARIGQRQPASAMADLDEALKLKPDHVAALVVRGRLLLASGDDARAARDFEAAVRTDPNRELAVASVYSAAGRYEAAIPRYDAWIAAHPKSEAMPAALNARCWARTLWGREMDKALADCEAAVRRGPHVAALFDSRGLAHLRRGEFDLAIADYDEALRLQPKLAWSLYGRGLARYGKGLTAEGEADLQAAAAIAPDLPAEAKRHGFDRPAGAPQTAAGR